MDFPIPNCVIVCHGGHQQVWKTIWRPTRSLLYRTAGQITYQRGIPDTSFTCLHLTAHYFNSKRKTTEFQYDIQSRKMTSRLRQLVDNFTAGRLFSQSAFTCRILFFQCAFFCYLNHYFHLHVCASICPLSFVRHKIFFSLKSPWNQPLTLGVDPWG